MTLHFRILSITQHLAQTLEELVPSQDMVGYTSQSNRAHQEVVGSLDILSHRVNAILEFMDPQHYAHAVELRRRVHSMFPFTRSIAAIDPLVYEGREILANVQMSDHTDRFDPIWGNAIIAGAGEHRDGYLRFPNLGLRVRLNPGDIVMFRGRVLRHSVEPWSGGQRISIPHFTHSTVWKMMGMEECVGGDAEGKAEDEVEDED